MMHLIEEQIAEVHAPCVIGQAAAALAEAQVVGKGFTLLRVLLGMEQEPQLAITPAPEGVRMEQIPPAQVHLQAVQPVSLMSATSLYDPPGTAMILMTNGSNTYDPLCGQPAHAHV